MRTSRRDRDAVFQSAPLPPPRNRSSRARSQNDTVGECELGTGEQARVIRQSDDPFSPTVRVITDADGNALDSEEQPTIELCDPACDSVRAILRAADSDRFVTNER